MHQYALVYYINCVCIVCIESIVCIVWIVCISLLHAFVNFLSSNFECTKEKGNFNTYQFAIFQSASLVILVWAYIYIYVGKSVASFSWLTKTTSCKNSELRVIYLDQAMSRWGQYWSPLLEWKNSDTVLKSETEISELK